MTASILRWGVLGSTSRIYRKALAPVFAELPDHEVVAEASLTEDGPEAYAELVARADVDAVYLPLPNHLHPIWIERCLAAGKHVLCEKPIALDAAQVDTAFDAAEAHGRHLIEAYMWPHHGRSRRALELVGEGAIGWPRFLHASFTYDVPAGDHRTDERGGGVLADVGIYCIGPAMLLAGREPRAASCVSVRDAAGIDRADSGVIDWGEGFASTFQVCLESVGRTTLEIVGTDGIMTFPDYWPAGADGLAPIHIDRADGRRTEQVDDGNGYRGMVEQFAAVVRGEAEPVFTPEHSRRLAHLLERLAESAVPRAG